MIQTRSNKIILKCPLSRKKREKTNIVKIHDWSKLMHLAPTLFKDAKKVIVDKQCGNIYVFFNKSHLSLHYLYKTKTGCRCWTKQSHSNKRSNHIIRKNKSTSSASNMHYKITEDKEHPIYIPIFVKREKFTYDNKVNISSYHKKWINYCIEQLNTYTTFNA